MIKVPAAGPSSADIFICGEAPGSSEEQRGQPFVGSSGIELTRMLVEAGINREVCFVTNVCKYRPPSNDISNWFMTKTQAKKLNIYELNGRYPNEQILEGVRELHHELTLVQPKVIIALGDTALWALCGYSGISKWRGSELSHNGIPVIPTYHPAAILRQWSWRFIAVQDLRRANDAIRTGLLDPKVNFTIRPNFAETIACIDRLTTEAQTGEALRLAVDIETRGGHIACLGLAWSGEDALCIPLMQIGQGHTSYWCIEEEIQIVWALRALLTHPRVAVVGQNWLYDMQYIAKHWGFIPWPHLDTMIAHHVAFAGLPKGLDFLASLYNEHYTYWKDEGKTWDPRHTDEEQLWVYNCKDCIATFEASLHIEKTISDLGLQEPLTFQMAMVRPVLKAMLRGVLTSSKRRSDISRQLLEAMIDRENFINYIVGEPVNVRSTPQMKKLFYTRLGVTPTLHKKTKKPTLAKGALGDLRKKSDPIIHPLIDAIIEYRRAGTFNSVAMTKIDADNRIRCSYNIAGTETYRLSSSEDAFGFGTNLQNISKGD
jgi:DNA polymerase